MNETTDISAADAAQPVPADWLSIEVLLPGEDPADKEALMTSLLDEFAPATAYQRRLAEQLAEYEWEIQRHRRLRDASVLAAYRTYTSNILIRDNANFFGSEANASEDDRLLLRDLTSMDRVERLSAEEDFLMQTHWHPHHVLAMAAGNSKAANAHEARIVDLERRRSQLRKEYAEMKAIRRSDVEDAEVVAEEA